jgi:hypothetical protein
MNWLKSIVILLIEKLLSSLSPETLNKVADKALDWVEDVVKRSDNDIDDSLILPLLDIIRSAFNIQD